MAARIASFAIAGCVVAPVVGNAQTLTDVASLSLTSSVSGGDSIGASSSDGAATGGSGARLASDLQAGFSFKPAKYGPLSWQLSAGSAVRRQSGIDRTIVLGHSVGASAGISIGRRTMLNVSESLQYLPSYSFLSAMTQVPGTAGELPSSAVDFSMAVRPATTSSTQIGLTTKFGARSSLAVTSQVEPTRFANPADPSLLRWSGMVRFTHQFTKYVGLRLGYGRQTGQYSRTAGRSRTALDDLDVGLDYNKALSLSLARKLNLTFASGSNITLNGQERRFNLTGQATLDRRIGRQGHLTLTYDRSAKLVLGFVDPVFADTITTAATGEPTRRVKLNATTAASLGAVGARTSQNQLRTYTATARADVALSQTVGVSVDGLFSTVRIGSGVERIDALPPASGRWTARLSLRWTLPLVQRRIREGERK